MGKKKRVEATPEEQEMMKRAEAKANAIGKETSTQGYTFDQEAEEKRAIEAKPRSGGLTIVNAGEQVRKESLAGNVERLEKIRQEALNMGAAEARDAEFNLMQSQLELEKAPSGTQTFPPQQAVNSPVLQKVLGDDKATNASNTILSEGTKNAESISDLEQVEVVSDAAKDLEEIEKNKLETGIANAASTYLQNIGDQQGGSPSYDGTATKDDVVKDVVKSYAAADNAIPQVVIEKLGVQDYYPEANRDIAVGTFTGSRIGSQTIYSGAGALMPMGLYDARKRALSQAAKDKQAAVDKYLDVIETAPQYQEKFNVSTMDWMNDALYNKHKGNSDAFIKDPEVRKEYARRKGLAKELTHYSKWSDDLLKDAADEKKYVTKDMVDIAGEIKSALINNADDVVSGKFDLGPLFAKAQVYQNIVPQVDIMVKEALSESALGKSPINLRTGGEYDSEKFQKEANDFLKQVKTGDVNYKDFLTGFKRYFTGDYEQAIGGLIQSGKYSEEQKEAALNYFAGQMQTKYDFEHKIVDSKAIDWAQLQERRRQFDAEYARKIEEGKTHFEVRREEMNFVDSKTGQKMGDIIQDLKNKGIKGDQLNKKILEVARRNGITNVTIDPYTNSVVIKEKASNHENNNPRTVNNADLGITLKEKVIINGKPDWKYFTVRATDINKLNLKGRKLSYEDNTPFTNESKSEITKAIKDNKLVMRTNSYELGYAYSDPKKSNIVTISPETINGYSSDRMVLVNKRKGKVSYSYTDKNGNKITKALPGTFVTKNEFSSDNGVNSNNENWGQKVNAENAFYGLGGGESSGSYSSY